MIKTLEESTSAEDSCPPSRDTSEWHYGWNRFGQTSVPHEVFLTKSVVLSPETTAAEHSRQFYWPYFDRFLHSAIAEAAQLYFDCSRYGRELLDEDTCDVAALLERVSKTLRIGSQTRFTDSDAISASAVSLLQDRIEREPNSPRARLARLAGLSAGWDGYQAPSIPTSLVGRALSIMSEIDYAVEKAGIDLPPPGVGPSPAGSIHFEWDLPSGDFASIECPAEPQRLALYIERRDGSEITMTARTAAELAEALVSNFSA